MSDGGVGDRVGATRSCTLSLILPAYNEAEGLEIAVADAGTALASLVWAGVVESYEILLVDDGSVDATPDVAAARVAADAMVRTTSHDRNRGVGAALRTGLDMARGAYSVWTDSDMPVDLRVIGDALALHRSGAADIVVGARTDRRGDGPVRWACTVGYDLAVRLALGVRVNDVNFAFKLAPTDLLRSLDLRSEGAFIDAELVATVLRQGRTVEVMPMKYKPRQFGTSSTLTPSTLLRLGREFASEIPRLRRVHARCGP